MNWKQRGKRNNRCHRLLHRSSPMNDIRSPNEAHWSQKSSDFSTHWNLDVEFLIQLEDGRIWTCLTSSQVMLILLAEGSHWEMLVQGKNSYYQFLRQIPLRTLISSYYSRKFNRPPSAISSIRSLLPKKWRYSLLVKCSFLQGQGVGNMKCSLVLRH